MSLMSIVEGRHSRKNRGKIMTTFTWSLEGNERIDCGHRMDIICVYFCIDYSNGTILMIYVVNGILDLSAL